MVQSDLPFDAPGTAAPGTMAPGAGHPVFVRHPQARRYVIRVTDDGRVRVTIPRGGSKKEAAAFAARERAWIAKQQRRLDEERARRQHARAADSPPAPSVSKGELDALRERARRELSARLIELALPHGLTVTRVTVRDQKWRWGSCSRSGHICLNWRLVGMPARVRDYVLIHELMHLKRMDHSPRFWKLVAAACPGFQDARAWLRAHARHDTSGLDFHLPTAGAERHVER